jgi:arylsulfatase A-like enzyme
VVILAADHGEAFTEHGLFWHANSLYDEELHVPLLVRGPGIKMQRIEAPVSLLDLAPTILDLAEAKKPKAFSGTSLIDSLYGASVPKHVLRFENGFPAFASANELHPGYVPPPTLASAGMHSDDFLVIQSDRGARMGDMVLLTDKNKELLFNVARDPGEQMHLSATSTEARNALPSLQKELQSMLQKK